MRKGKAKPIINKGSKTIEKFDNIIGNKIHETEKPLELITNYLLNSTNKNDWVLDPFGGSCVLNISGLIHLRRIFSIELDADKVHSGINRCRNFLKTGIDRIITD